MSDSMIDRMRRRQQSISQPLADDDKRAVQTVLDAVEGTLAKPVAPAAPPAAPPRQPTGQQKPRPPVVATESVTAAQQSPEGGQPQPNMAGKRAKQRGGNPYREDGRLPDGAVFHCVYDADAEMWTGTLTIHGCPQFADMSSGLFKLNRKLDGQYRRWLAAQGGATAEGTS